MANTWRLSSLNHSWLTYFPPASKHICFFFIHATLNVRQCSKRDLQGADRWKDSIEQLSPISNKLCHCSNFTVFFFKFYFIFITVWGKLLAKKNTMWKLWQWNKRVCSSLHNFDVTQTGFCFVFFFPVWRPVSPNLGYITPADCTKLTSLCFWNLIQIQTSLVNPGLGDVWDKNTGLWKYSFPPQWRGTEWLSSFQMKKAFLCQRPSRNARITKGGSKQMHYS